MSCFTSLKSVTLQQLEGTWKIIDPVYDDLIETWKISDQTLTWIDDYIYSDHVETNTHFLPFYLFNGVPKSYDASLVGKSKDGTDIIYYVKQAKKIKNYKIISIKNDTLILSDYAPRAVGRNAGTVILTLKRVSRKK